MICTIPSHSQQVKFQKNTDEKVPGIYVKKKNKKRVYKISEGTKIRCKTSNSSTIKGKIYGVKDSSIVFQNAEISVNEIKSITECNGTEAMLIAFAPFSGGASLILIPFVNIKYDFTKKWEFYYPFNTGIDSTEIKKMIKRKDTDSIEQLSFSKFSLTLYPLNSLINQHSLELGYQLSKKIYFGIEGGYIKADCWWNNQHQLYNGTDDKNPVGYYDGWSVAFHFKILEINKHHWYFEAVPFCKFMAYDHVLLVNTFGDPNPVVKWERSENLNIYGLKLMLGRKLFVKRNFSLQTNLGVSIRKREREYYTYWTYAPYNIDSRCNQWIHDDQIKIGIQAGLSLSLGNFKQK